MKTITKTYEVYPITELSQQSVENAYYNWLSNCEYFYGSDNERTLDNFCELLQIKCFKWSYDAHTYSFRCEMKQDEAIQSMKGVRLATYIHNNFGYCLFISKTYYGKNKKRNSSILKEKSCVLTGYYIDEYILEPIYRILNKPDKYMDFYSLIRECLNKYFEACRDDVAHCQSQEYFKEESLVNGREYLSDGTLFSIS